MASEMNTISHGQHETSLAMMNEINSPSALGSVLLLTRGPATSFPAGANGTNKKRMMS